MIALLRSGAAAIVSAALCASASAQQLTAPRPLPSTGVAAALGAERASVERRRLDVLARGQEHNARCARVASTDSATIAECERSRRAMLDALNAYRQALEAYEANLGAAQVRAAAPPRRTYVRSGNGLVGGMTWILGYNVPPGAAPGLRQHQLAMLRQQAQRAGQQFESLDLDQFNFMIGVAAATEPWLDLGRVLRDEASLGRWSADNQALYASLRGREFNKLSCHSNGAMICLAALVREDVRAGDVVLYGPQITDESLAEWDNLLRAGRIRSLRIIVNQNDAIPPAALLFGRALGGRALGGDPILFDQAALARQIHAGAPSAQVDARPCGQRFRPGVACHFMTSYDQRSSGASTR